jgi:hypothetical protein
MINKFKIGAKVKWLCQLGYWDNYERIRCTGRILKIYHTTVGATTRRKVAQIEVDTKRYTKVTRRKKTTISLSKLELCQ